MAWFAWSTTVLGIIFLILYAGKDSKNEKTIVGDVVDNINVRVCDILRTGTKDHKCQCEKQRLPG